MPEHSFQTRVGHLLLGGEKSDLPFAVGAATQHNHAARDECQNSQDATSLILRPGHLVGVVADGCSGTHPRLQGVCRSSNEVGAKLCAYVISQSASKVAADTPEWSDSQMIGAVETSVRSAFARTMEVFCGASAEARELFAADFLTTTVLAFVVGQTRFIVFRAGNGVVAVNGDLKVLDDGDGSYVPVDAVDAPVPGQPDVAARRCFQILHSGPSASLQSILIASDGLVPLATKYPEPLLEFVRATPAYDQIEGGFDYLLQEFRGRFAWNPMIDVFFEDDASLVLLRRKSVGGSP